MPIIAEVRDYHDELTAIRRDIHAHPELALPSSAPPISSRPSSPNMAARCIAGLPGPGSSARSGAAIRLRAIGLRADMDACRSRR